MIIIEAMIAKVFRDTEERQIMITTNMNIVRDASSYCFEGEKQEREIYDLSMPVLTYISSGIPTALAYFFMSPKG